MFFGDQRDVLFLLSTDIGRQVNVFQRGAEMFECAEYRCPTMEIGRLRWATEEDVKKHCGSAL